MNKLFSAVALALALAGCAQATADNYAKLKNGMTQDEVHRIIGKPTRVGGGGIGDYTMTTETYKGPEQLITLTFANGKLAMKTIGGVTDERPEDTKGDN